MNPGHYQRLVTALLMGVSLFASLSAAASISNTDNPPDGANDWSCRPSAAHPNPVILVHGTFVSMAADWGKLSPLLAQRGYCVFALNYGIEPAIPLVYGVGPIEESAQQLSAFVTRVLAATGAARVDIVGHSQGGMMPRYYLKFLNGAVKVRRLIGLAPSNHGTTVLGLVNLGQRLPLADELLMLFGTLFGCTACNQQLAGSDFLNTLNSGGDTVPGVDYTVIATKLDLVVTPYTSQFLVGSRVTNITLQDQCKLVLTDHLLISYNGLAIQNVLNALDPAHALTPTCKLLRTEDQSI